MTKYVIQRRGGTVRRWLLRTEPDQYWTDEMTAARRFDSMTEANIFAIEAGIVTGYIVVPVEG